jgi:hypothetical protein
MTNIPSGVKKSKKIPQQLPLFEQDKPEEDTSGRIKRHGKVVVVDEAVKKMLSGGSNE